ncbi:YSIRK signal domain/LPXTG anchor domain surface protein [Streptococcus mitis]|uniref:LPXTG-motif cell wall anchor domain protein n=1 Tax=Streptococcus mitis TaxID=28037 RepID=A0A081QXM5_STRMT|nr:YSIRK signal domain/LPXTG anchor domain surface protein [Streptococcus mitis]KEQ47698.1 LPXTG-motif cell wall anchor domain protein [Streptococcus mitis]
MEHKSNSYKVNRQQREKVLRFSIRKYSFGAASVAVAALMFLGARVASADSVSETTAPSAAGVVSPKDEAKSPLGITESNKNKVDEVNKSLENKEPAIAENSASTVDKAKLRKVVEELNSLLSTKLNLNDSVVSPIKDRLQKGKEALENSDLAQKDIDELVELLSKDVTVLSAAAKESTEIQGNKTEKQADNLASASSSEVRASEESQTVSAKKEALKVSVDQLQAAVLELPEHETSKEVLEKANELLGLAQEVLENTTVSLNDVEEMNKLVKRMFNSVKNATTRLTSGARDSRNGQSMGQGSNLRSAPIDKTTKRGSLGIVVADSGFITGYATPSSTIEIKRNGQKILTSKLDDTGAFKLNAPGIKVGDKVELVVNGQSVYNTTVSQVDTVAFNDSLAGVAQVDGYTASEADVEISIGGKKYTTKSQSNGYFTVNVDPKLMVKGATITAVVKKNGKEVGRGTSNVRETRKTDFGVGWNKNPMLNYSERDVYSPDTKQYAFVSVGTADKAYDNIRVYREERIEKDGNKYYYWIVDSGPAENALAGSSKKISLAIPRTVGDPYDFTYTKYKDGSQISHQEYASASKWEYENTFSRAYVKNGERRSGSTYGENIGSWMDYAHPDNSWRKNIYRDSRKDGTDRNPDAASRVKDMYGITTGGLIYNLARGVIEDKLNVVAGQRTIITFKTKILEGDELDQSIMSDWGNKNKNNPMLADIKKRLANDPYLAYGGYSTDGLIRYRNGQNAIIGTLPLKPEEAAKYDLKPKSKPQSTKVGVIPDAYNSIANPNELPAGTTYRWFKDPDVSRPTAPNAPVYGKVEVTIPERGKFIVDAPVHVVDDKAQTPVATAKDNGDVTAKPQDPKKVDKIKVSFTGEDNKQKTAEGTKGTNGKWTVNNPDVRIDPNTGEITIPANKVKDLTEVTAVTKNGNGADSDPAKATAKDVQKPQATLNGITLTETANTPIFTVYRGADFNPELKVWDNSGKISKVTVGNLPGGVSASNFTAQTGKDGSSEDKKYKTRLSSGRVLDTQTLGEHTATLHVEGSSATDSRDLKFKYRVVDITTKNLENGVAKVPVGSTLNVPNSRTNVDAHNYLKVVDSQDQSDRGNSHLPQGMTWTWKAGDNLDPGTTLDNSGKYTRNATAQFPSSVTDNNSTTRTTFAPTEIKRPVVLAVTPTAPSVVANENGSVTVTPPTRPNGTTPQDIDTITLTYTPTGKTTPETVTVAKSGNNWTVNGKTTDKVSVTPAGVVTISDLEVADAKEVTAKVSKRIDNNVVLESPVAKVTSKSSKPAKPVATAKDNGDVTGKPQDPAKADKITVSYTGEDNQPKTAVGTKDPKGKWTVNTPEVQINPNTGEITIPENKVKDGTEVTVVTKNGNGTDSDPAKATAKFSKPAKPVATAKDNGDVTGKPQNPAKADKITVSYTGEDNTPKTAVGTKDPKGKWTVNTPEVQINPNTGEITIPENKVKDGTEVTVVTKNGNGADSDPAKVTAKDVQKPQATLNGIPLTETANSPIFTVYRGATFNPELKVWDNSGVISKVEVKGGLPKGVTASTFTSQTGKTEANPYATRLSSGTVLNTETLGEHEATLHVEGSSATDSRDLKFKYRVVDIETRNLENGIAKVPVASTLNVANSGKNIDAHRYLKVVDSEDKADRGNNYLPSGMTWTWKAGDKLDSGTTLDNSGKYTRNATAVFPDTSKNSITDVNSTTRTTFAPAEIKRQVVLAVTPTVPSVVGHENGSVTITPPTRPNSTNPQDIDTITLTYVPTGKTTPETVTVTKSGNTWTVNGKTADKVSVTPAGVVTISDAEVADKTEITAKVSKRIDNVVLESPVARGTANGSLGAEVTPPAPVLEKEKTTPVTVVTPNKPGSTITTETPVNGLTVDGDGNLTGTPTVTDWGPKEEERKVTIPVKVKHGDEVVPVNVPVTIQRDTDGDGIPDVTDPDDDNDGIPDKDDANPKVADKLTGDTTGKTVKEKTPVPANTKVVTPNKPGTTITVDGPVNGLTVDNGGNLVGTPSITDWGPKEEERTVEIPVKLKRGTEETVVKVPVNIERDTDGDGIPDKVDPDDDNDGIPDKDDANPKVADKLTGTVTEKTVPEKTPVPANTKVITPNKPGTTITVDGPVNGLTVDQGGNLVGTPSVTDWGPKEEERTVEIPVKLKRGTEETVVKVPVKIQRDTDGDGIPDVTDPDDDNDGIPDKDDANPKVADKLTGTVTDPGKVKEKAPVPPTKVVTPNKPGSTITTETPVNGLTVDGDGNLTGTPTVTDWGPKEEERKVTIPVKVKNGDEEVTVDVPVTIQRDTDGDGIPDVTDPDDDNDGIPDKDEEKNGTDPKTPTTQTPTIDITRKPNGDAVITPKKPDGSTYPPGTVVEIPGKDGNPIVVTIGEDGSGIVPNDKLPKGDLPGKGTVTEPNKEPSQPVPVTTPARKNPTIKIEQDPKTGDVTVTPKKPDGSIYPPGTVVEIPGKDGNPITVTIGEDGKGKVPNSDLPEGDIPGTGKIIEKGKTPEEVQVKTPKKLDPNEPQTEQPVSIDITRKPNGDAIVTPKKPGVGGTYPPGTKVVIPGDNDTPIEVIIGEDGSGIVPNDSLPKGKIEGEGTVTEPNKRPSQPVPATTPARKTPTVDLEQDPKTGDVTVTPKRPDGSTYPPGTVVEIPGKGDKPITVTIGEDGKGKVPNSELPDGKVTKPGKITEPGKPSVEVPEVTTPAKVTPTVDLEQDPKTGDVTVTPKKPDGSTYPPGTVVEIPGKGDKPITVTIGEDGKGKVPNSELPDGKVTKPGKITEPDKPSVEVPEVTTPAKVTPTVDLEQDPKTGDVTVTPKRPDGSIYPPGTVVEIPGKDGKPITVTIGEDGKGKVPNSELPDGKVTKPGKITEPGKPSVEVPEVTTPAKVTPTVDLEQDPKTGDVTVTPKRPDGSTYPPGTVVEIPGKGDKPITVTIGEDGKGKVPNSELPDGEVTKPGKITEPGKPAVEVPNVTTPAHKTPTLDVKRDPETGDVTLTPKRPDGTTYPPGTTVEIPGKDGKPITVTIGEDGKGKVPNSDLPDVETPGTGKITEPGKPAVEVPNVTTPAKFTPETPVTEKPGKIEITQQPNGNAIVTPKKPDGTTYPSGSRVEIPGENGTTITVTIGDNGSGEVPNDNLPKTNVPGTGTVTEPNKKPSQPVDVTTPARKTPTLDVKRDPETGDVTVTPKKPDGSIYPPGTVVEIPGKDGKPITVTIGEDGKGKVPNSDLPDVETPGTGKITEPGKPAVEVPNVTTPAKFTPETPVTEKPGKIEITQQPNGNAIVTPKKSDGTTYPSGSKVEIPGENGTTITVTIGDNGSGEVPNDKLPKGDLPGTGTVTEPNKKPSQPVDVTTPARKTPTIELDQDPKTGDVTVTPKKPDGSTYPPGTKVEIPGKDGNPIIVTIDKEGKGKVPNSELPDGKVPGTGKITEPGQPAVEVPVETPAKVTPATQVTEKPGKIEITQQPNGNAIVTPKKPDGTTYPSGSRVEIPGENGTTITVTIGDNGSGEVPNDNLPKTNVPGTGTVTEPNKKPSQPVDVTTPARKTPTLDVKRDPETGDVTVTPKKPDGSIYPPGTTVEIPGKDGKPITVTIGEDGKGKVPNSDLPDVETPGTGKITEPGKSAVEVPNVTTPAKFTPETPVTEKPGKIEITQQPNGNAIVTPKKPDGSTYPPGTKVEIPGENGTTITVTIGDNGSGEVPNDKLPKGDLPGKGTVTEPNKKPSQPVDVTTPARKTPTIELDQDPKTGDVTVTPKKPDGSTYPPGTTVEIPGKDGNPIVVTIDKEGKGKVPNSELPDGKVPGTGKITEPGKAAVEVPVETPAKVTPATPTDTIPVAPVTPDTPVNPDTNGGSGQDTPAPATPTPNAVTPNADQVDTKTTVDNGANSNDSQNVLPNTGTESNAALASLGLLGLLNGFGLVARKKKED